MWRKRPVGYWPHPAGLPCASRPHPARNVKKYGAQEAVVSSGMGVEGAHTILEWEILGENIAGEFGEKFWRDNLAGYSAILIY